MINTKMPWNKFDNTEAEFYSLLEKYEEQTKNSDNPQQIADLISLLHFLDAGTLDDLEEDEVSWAFDASKKSLGTISVGCQKAVRAEQHNRAIFCSPAKSRTIDEKVRLR